MAVSRITDEADLGSFADFLGNEITAIFLSKEKFKAYDINIVNFSVQFLKSNAENELPVTRDDIEFYWWLAVRKVFKTGDPDQDRLLQQAHALTFRNPWTKTFLDASEAEMRRRKKQSPGQFRPTGLPCATNTHYPRDTILQTRYETLLIPGINLKRVQDLNFLALGIEVSRANPDVVISYPRFNMLWRAIMEKVYDFENPHEMARKIEESRTVNHLDFKLAVGNISLWEYDQRMMENNEEAALSDAHFNESPTEGFNTDSNEDAPAEDINITELEASGSRNKKRRRKRKKNTTTPAEFSETVDGDDALLDVEEATILHQKVNQLPKPSFLAAASDHANYPSTKVMDVEAETAVSDLRSEPIEE